jgi:hypothetical protein
MHIYCRTVLEQLYGSITAYIPTPDPLVLNQSQPYHTHILHRSAHARARAALAQHYIAPFGGTRDHVSAQLERMTSGPPAARPPVVYLSGPAHSGRSSALAHFAHASKRCSAQRRLDHSVAAEPVFPHRGRGAEEANWERESEQGVVVSAFMAGGGGALRCALEYITMEIAVQRRGVDAFGTCAVCVCLCV